MQQRISINPLQNRERVNDRKSRTQAHYESISLICFGGGILGLLLGLFLFFALDFADKANAALKYRGLAVIFAAFFMLGCGAHFMDKFDDERGRIRKLRIEELDRKKLL